MATTNYGFTYPFDAGGNLSDSGSPAIYRFVRFGSIAGEVLRATGGSNPYPLGILQSNPGASGLEAPVTMWGWSQVYADAGGAPVGYGSFLTAGSDGQAVVQTGTSSSNPVSAIALEALASGSGVLINCLVLPFGIKLGAS